MSNGSGGMDAKAFIQELKTNRKTQAASAIFLLVAGWMGYTLFAPDKPQRRAAAPSGNGAGAGTGTTASLDARQAQALRALPDLARLGKAGELPSDAKMRRDIFLFDGPPRPYVPPKEVLPPPKTPEQLEAERLQAIADRLQAAKDIENSKKPNNIRYLGFLQSRSAGLIGTFMKGEEPHIMRVGDMANPSWKLIEITEKAAIFRNMTFADLRYAMEPREPAGGGRETGAQTATNEF